MPIPVNDLSRFFENNQDNNPSGTMYDVKVIAEKYDDSGKKKILVLQDHREYTIEFPAELCTLNCLSAGSRNVISMSRDMYNIWFQRAYHQDYKHLSDIAFRYFGKLLEKSNLILQNEAYCSIRLPFMRSYIFYVGNTNYSLGALVRSWIETDTFFMDNGMYMMSITGSSLNDLKYFKAWCPHKKKIVTDRLSDNKKHGMSYFEDFRLLENEYADRNRSDLHTLQLLLTMLDPPMALQ